MARARISSREYKVLLHADRFAGDEVAIATASGAFWQAFRRAIDGVGLDTDGRLEVEERRLIRFYDTSDLCLHRNDYIFRERIDAGSGERQVTLKFRHPDRYLAASRDLSPASARDARTKFEEDIKAPFQGFFSHSTTLEIGGDKDLDRLDDAGRLFPGLRPALERYDGGVAIAPVGGLTVREVVLAGADFQVGRSPKVEAECALVLWYDAAGDGHRPEVVEFSYRYGDDDEAYGGAAAQRAYRIFLTLQQEAFRGWVDPNGMTKTAFVYRHVAGRSQPALAGAAVGSKRPTAVALRPGA